ncbi:hypothetical protein RUM44_000184 [Polyplax serrata]|uniref:Uncharacterized protein n=1 Tax=Polyplax serrata TaxID=468196 RepID=A0ABR1B682_POLSC
MKTRKSTEEGKKKTQQDGREMLLGLILEFTSTDTTCYGSVPEQRAHKLNAGGKSLRKLVLESLNSSPGNPSSWIFNQKDLRVLLKLNSSESFLHWQNSTILIE